MGSDSTCRITGIFLKNQIIHLAFLILSIPINMPNPMPENKKKSVMNIEGDPSKNNDCKSIHKYNQPKNEITLAMIPFPKKKKLVPIKRYTPNPNNAMPRKVKNMPAFVRNSIALVIK